MFYMWNIYVHYTLYSIHMYSTCKIHVYDIKVVFDEMMTSK